MVLKLFVACAALLAMPGTAMAITITGPTSVGEADGVATYEVQCGNAAGGLPYLGTVTIELDPAATGADYGAPTVSTYTDCALVPTFEFDVPINDDAVDEINQGFKVTASGIAVPSGVIATTIVDDDPTASIAPVVVVKEGDSGTQDAELEVTLSSPPVQATTIKYATEELTAVAGEDYEQTSGDLVFQPGETMKTISVPVIGDTTFEEKPEALLVNLRATDNGTLDPKAKQAAIGIFDNDPRPIPAISIDRTVTVNEGDRGTVNALFTVSLSFVPTERAEVSWKTLDWTADSDDYQPGSGKLVFEPGQRTKTISVNVKGDRDDEPVEAFGVVLENPAAATLAATKSGFGIIADDDGPTMGIGKPKVKRRVIVTKLACPETASRCSGTFRPKAGKFRFRKQEFDLQKGASTKVRSRMARKTRKRLRKRALRVKLVAVASDAEGDKQKTVRKARLKRRR